MENQDKELAGIILRSIASELTPEEKDRLNSYLQASEANRQKYRELTTLSYMEAGLKRIEQYQEGQPLNLESILHRVNQPALKPVRKQPVRWYWAAAALLLIAGAAWYWQHTSPTLSMPAKVPARYADVAPGHTGAVLTLADGRQLTLDSMAHGLIATQNGANINLQSGQLSYKATGTNNAAGSYNTISTPKGRQFAITLPDGTKVWLNAASTLTYPTAFNGRQRRVKLSGEAYFEVIHNAQQPFMVDIDQRSTVEVLGTSFNINAYTDETAIKTTLLSGSLRTGGVILQPGQQASQKPGEAVIIQNNTDLEKVTAWKNGRFDFNDAGLPEVMRQLERWYDIEVIYEKGVPDTYFYGKISKDLPLSGILKALAAAHVHFRIDEGRKLVVMP